MEAEGGVQRYWRRGRNRLQVMILVRFLVVGVFFLLRVTQACTSSRCGSDSAPVDGRGLQLVGVTIMLCECVREDKRYQLDFRQTCCSLI